MTQYGIKFFKIEDGEEMEVEMDNLPNEYICGLIKMLKDDMFSRERIDRVFKKMADDISNKN